MKSILKIVVTFFLISLFSVSYAGLAPENLKVLETSDSSISLDWDDTQDVIGYYIYYGTQTASWSSYEVEWIDLIDESAYVLEGLVPETRYYIAMTSVDEFGTESAYSDEIEYETLKQGEVSQAISFRVNNVSVIDATSIQLEFSTDLETGPSATRAFIIEEESTGTEIPVDISDVLNGEPRSVVVVLGWELTIDTKYKVTVLDISDAQWNTIESWIDAFINFTTWSSFTPELESAGPEETTPELEETPVEETATPVVDDTQGNGSQGTIGNNAGISIATGSDDSQAEIWNNGGTNISISENTLSAAWENGKLPQTGPEHWILAFIAMLLAGAVYYMSSRKES